MHSPLERPTHPLVQRLQQTPLGTPRWRSLVRRILADPDPRLTPWHTALGPLVKQLD